MTTTEDRLSSEVRYVRNQQARNVRRDAEMRALIDEMYAIVMGGGGGAGSILYFSVDAYGAEGDGVTDDSNAARLAIAAASAAGGGTVYFPAGTYLLSRYASTSGCLFLESNVWLRGAGKNSTTLKMAPATAVSVGLIIPNTARGGAGAAKTDITISDMTLDGDRTNQTVEAQPHRDGVFAENVENFRIHRVRSQNFAGDGVYIGTQANYTQMTDTLCQLNDRNGCTLANGGQHNFDAYGSTFIDNVAQAFDCESNGSAITENVTLTNCRFGNLPGSNSYVLTVWGYAATSKGKNWVVTGCQIDGPIYVVWCDDVMIRDCWGTNPTTRPWCEIWRNCYNVTIDSNIIKQTQVTTNEIPAIGVRAISNVLPLTSQPRDIFIRKNTITVSHSNAFAIDNGGGENVVSEGNRCYGPSVGGTIYAGIRYRATQDARRGAILNNTFRNIGREGVQLSGNQPFNYGFTAVAGTDVVSVTETATTSYFTAATTDILTAVTAGGSLTTTFMETGYGPIRFSSTGTLPAGISAATDYYWIKINTTTGKLATSLANALAGTPVVDITDTGTGAAGSHSCVYVAQPWQTGYGPLRVTNSGGALPAGLATSTDYWWIKVTGSTGKLAASHELALAGTAIDITDAGTGTHSLAMAFGFDYLEIHGNHCEDTATTATMTNGLYLEPGSGPSRYLSVRDNTSAGIANPIANYPLHNIVQLSGNRGGHGTFTCNGVPAFSAAIGSIAYRRNGSAGSLVYLNTDGARTWAAIA